MSWKYTLSLVYDGWEVLLLLLLKRWNDDFMKSFRNWIRCRVRVFRLSCRIAREMTKQFDNVPLKFINVHFIVSASVARANKRETKFVRRLAEE